VFTNPSIKAATWENYIKYLNLLSEYIQNTSKKDYDAEFKGELLTNCFETALRKVNKELLHGD